MASEFDDIRGIEKRELERLQDHLESLEADGWLEQSYDTEWRVYQVVSHLASQSVIYLGFLANWFEGSPPMNQEQMKAVWGKFDALEPGDMLAEFRQAISEYMARLGALPSEAGLKEVDSPFGARAKVAQLLAFRLQEVALHSWDVYVARDRKAVLPDDAVRILLPVQLQIVAMRKPAPLNGKRVRLLTPDGQWQRTLDFRGEKPVVQEGASIEVDFSVEGPAEELCRLLAGRHHLPGSLPCLTRSGGSYEEQAALNVFAH